MRNVAYQRLAGTAGCAVLLLFFLTFSLHAQESPSAAPDGEKKAVPGKTEAVPEEENSPAGEEADPAKHRTKKRLKPVKCNDIRIEAVDCPGSLPPGNRVDRMHQPEAGHFLKVFFTDIIRGSAREEDRRIHHPKIDEIDPVPFFQCFIKKGHEQGIATPIRESGPQKNDMRCFHRHKDRVRFG